MIALEQDWGIERGFRIKPTNPSMKALAPALVHWIFYIEKYCLLVPDDSPYWHSEWASVSTFAAAVWAAGGVATQEFAPPNQSGHGDLFFKIGDESYIAEAKITYNEASSFPAEKVYEDALKKLCREASEQVKYRESPIEDRGIKNKLTMLFFTPRFAADDTAKSTEEIKQMLIDYRYHIDKTDKFDLLCWCFPRIDQQTTPLTGSDGMQYPGVILAAKLIS